MSVPDKINATTWASLTTRQQSLRSLQSSHSLPKLRVLGEADEMDLVRVIVPTLTPFTLQANQSIGCILGVRKDKEFYSSRVWQRLSKRGRTVAYLLMTICLFVPQAVFILSLDEIQGPAWVGILALVPVAYLALFMNVRVLRLTFSQFEARFLGINVLAWTASLYYSVHNPSVRVGALSMIGDTLLLMFWDALPQFFRHERTLSLVLPISAMLIWQSFVSFFDGVRYDKASLQIAGVDFHIPARLSAFAATTGVYGLGHVVRWLSTKNDDFSTIRVPARSIKIPKQALEELNMCLREVRTRARRRSGALFSRKWTSHNGKILPVSSRASTLSTSGIRQLADPSPFAVLAASTPMQVNTSETFSAYWFGPRIGTAIFEWNKKLGYLEALSFQTGHFLVLWCIRPDGAWAWWLIIVTMAIPALAWLCIMNRVLIRLVANSFEFKFMLLNILGFCLTILMATQDARTAAAITTYLMSTVLGSLSDAFPRTMLTFKVRILLGIPNLLTLSILVYKISAGLLVSFVSREVCLAKSACVSQADLASGFGINMIAFLTRVGLLVMPSPSSLGSITMDVSILRVPDKLMAHYLALHHLYLEPDKSGPPVREDAAPDAIEEHHEPAPRAPEPSPASS